jgi:hypothetical protein
MAPLTFQVSVDGTNFRDLYRVQDTQGTFTPFEVVVPKVPSNTSLVLPTATGYSVAWIKVRSGTSTAPVAQAADRAFQLVLEQADVALPRAAARRKTVAPQHARPVRSPAMLGRFVDLGRGIGGVLAAAGEGLEPGLAVLVGQVRVLANALDMRETRFNIVLMGMGEPLHNYDETMKALRILTDEHGFAMSPRRITLSTVGLLPALERLAHEPVMPNLAISLHAPNDALRGELVPLNRKYGVGDIIDACRRFPLKRRHRITFEYVLLAGVNDSPADARSLAKLLSGVKSKVNLIPLNAAAGIPFERPSDEAIDRFARILADHGLTVSVRKSRGRDIRAACGQLIVEGQRKSPAQRLAVFLG